MLTSVCCKERPYEITDLEDLSGICSKCMKPTIFEKEDEKEVVPPKYEGFTCMWDMALDAIFGGE